MLKVTIKYSLGTEMRGSEVTRKFCGKYVDNHVGVEQLRLELGQLYDDFCIKYSNTIPADVIEKIGRDMADTAELADRCMVDDMAFSKCMLNRNNKSRIAPVFVKYGASVEKVVQ